MKKSWSSTTSAWIIINLTVTIDEKSQILPQKEFQLLYKLLSFPNHTFTRQQIMDELWGYDSETDIRTVDVHINRLRGSFPGYSLFSDSDRPWSWI